MAWPGSVSVCAPAFNEELGIARTIIDWYSRLIEDVRANRLADFEIVVCDDGSTDATRQIILDLKLEKVKLISLEKNRGAGVAVSEAIKASMMEWVITIDSDGQFALEDALAWIYERPKSNAVLGYRKKKDNLLYVLGSKTSTAIAQFTLKKSVFDANCMLKLLKGGLARQLPLRAVGMNYSGEMTYLTLMQTEVEWRPVTHKARMQGKSKSKFLSDGRKRILFQAFMALEIKLTKESIIKSRDFT